MSRVAENNKFSPIHGDLQIFSRATEEAIAKLPHATAAAAESAFYTLAFSIAGPPLYVVSRGHFQEMLAKQQNASEEMKLAFRALWHPSSAIAPGASKKVEATTFKHRVGVFLDIHAETIAKITLLALSTYYAFSWADEKSLDSSQLFKRIVTKGLIELGWAKMVGHYRLSSLTISHIFAINLSITDYLKWSAAGTAVELLSRQGIRYLASQLI